MDDITFEEAELQVRSMASGRFYVIEKAVWPARKHHKEIDYVEFHAYIGLPPPKYIIGCRIIGDVEGSGETLRAAVTDLRNEILLHKGDKKGKA